MADQKINDLTAAGSISGTMQIETDTGGLTANKATMAQVKSYAQNGTYILATNTADDITDGTTNTFLQIGAGTNSLLSHDATGAYNTGDIAIGFEAVAGTNGTATDSQNTAVGYQATAQGIKTTAIGENAEVITQITPPTNSTAIGQYARILGAGKSLAVGNDSKVEEAESSIALGSTAQINTGADNSICIGATSTITINGESSVIVGSQVTCNKSDCVVLGFDSDDPFTDGEVSYGGRLLRLGQIKNSSGLNPGKVGSLPSAVNVKEGSISWVTDGYNSNDALAIVADLGSGKQWYYIPPNITDLIGGGSDISVEDEGVELTAAVTSIDFVGTGVTATNTGGAVTVTVGGGAAPVDSVNGATGTVVLDADDLDDSATTNKFVTSSDITNLGNLSGTNTGDQTITLTGDVTGTGTGSFATTLANDSVTIAKISATGTPSSSTYLRGDGTWATPSGGGGDLLASNNLSDLNNAATALTNLGLTATATELNYTDGVTSAIQTQIDSKADNTISLNAQLGTTYTLVIGDASKYVRCNNASAITVTVPPNSSVAFATGTQIVVRQVGAGQVTFAQGSGVTINSAETLKLRGQHSTATLIKVGTDEWDLLGDLEESA